MFGLTDDKIIHAIDKKAKAGLTVRVLFDPRSSSLSYKWAEPKKLKGLLHQKIVVIDDKIVFIGSANLTPSSLSMHDNLTLGFYSPHIAAFIKGHPLESKRYFTGVSSQTVELWLLPDKRAVEALKKLMQSAKKSISIAMFTFTHPALVEEVINAKKRGVKVRVFLDYKSSRGASLKAAQLMKETVLVSRGSELLHHKYLLVDNKVLAVGSANWTKAAFEKNRDLLFIIHNLSLKQKKYLKKIERVMELECE